MSQNEVYRLYGIHKSIGAILFIFILWRVVWRMMNGFPKPVSNYSKAEQVLAKVVHWVLIIGTVLYPLSGLMMSVLGGHGLEIFGLELIGSNIVNGEPIPTNEKLSTVGSKMHHAITPIMIGAILLHVLGALKHHLIDKDDTIRRMTGRVK